MSARVHSRYGTFAVLRASVLLFAFAAFAIVGMAFVLDRNAQRATEQQTFTELAGAARVAASDFSAVRANLRARVGEVASTYAMQQAVVRGNATALARIAAENDAQIVVHGHAYGTVPAPPRITASATVGTGSNVLARVVVGLRLDDRLLGLLAQATPLPRHAGFALARDGLVTVNGTAAPVRLRGDRITVGSTRFLAKAVPLHVAGAQIVAVEPVSAVAARERPYRNRLFLVVLISLAAAAGLAVRLARPAARFLATVTQLRYHAQTDALTGLANRRTLNERLDEEVDRAARTGTHLSFLIADIDNFKQVNDTYGHQTGDLVLAEVARVVADGVRDIDLVARYGGEELGFVLPGTRLQGARLLADRLRTAVEELELETADGTRVGVTVSFGVASFPTHEDVEALVRAADEALYEAKQTGKNRVVSATARKKRASAARGSFQALPADQAS
jgi:diguanylate cyclase (GGDEF)-like protein